MADADGDQRPEKESKLQNVFLFKNDFFNKKNILLQNVNSG